MTFAVDGTGEGRLTRDLPPLKVSTAAAADVISLGFFQMLPVTSGVMLMMQLH